MATCEFASSHRVLFCIVLICANVDKTAVFEALKHTLPWFYVSTKCKCENMSGCYAASGIAVRFRWYLCRLNPHEINPISRITLSFPRLLALV